MFKKIIGALFIGCIATVGILQNDYDIKMRLLENVQAGFAQMFASTLQARVQQINVFSPTIELADMVVTPHDNAGWSWSCKTYKGQFSWWQLLRSGVLALHITIEGLHLVSTIENNDIAIRDHLEKLLDAPALPIPMVIQSINLKNVSCAVHEPIHDIQASLACSGQVKLQDKVYSSQLYVHDGALKKNNHPLLKQLHGTCTSTIVPQDFAKSIVNAEIKCMVASAEKEYENCSFSGVFENKQGSFALKNADDSLTVGPLALTIHNDNLQVDAQARVPLSCVGALCQLPANAPLGGTATLQATATVNRAHSVAQGAIVVKDVAYNNKLLSSCITIAGEKKDTCCRGTIDTQTPIGDVTATWQWDLACNKAALSCINSTASACLGNWCVPAQKGSCAIFYAAGTVQGTYESMMHNVKTNDTLHLAGTVQGSAQEITVTTTVDDDYQARATVVRAPSFTAHASIMHKGVPLAEYTSNLQAPWSFSGNIQYAFIRSCVQHLFSYDMQGEGAFGYAGSFDKDNTLQVGVTFKNGTLRVPHTYNFINNLHVQATYSFNDRKLTVLDSRCGLHKGSVSCKHGYVYFDDVYKPVHMHVPVLFENCLLNVQKDVFASISGTTLLTGNPLQEPLLKGHLFLERAQIKTTVFSKEFYQKICALGGATQHVPPFCVQCDLTLETKDDIRIKTEFLDTTAKMMLAIKNKSNNPEVSGFISCTSGVLSFPYRPLYLTQGKVTFVPGALKDPLIELVAKNKIRNYTVAMRVTGSLENNHISLESTPVLTKQQIIALLCAGTPEESLAVVMPALFMHTIKNMVVDSGHSLLAQNQYINYLLAPLRSIRLVPIFNDQAARGGLRGAIEIDVSDRWRGLIQRNFTLTEDTRFEFEYFLSDEVSVRGFRNERRDIGGDVEVRWKF